MADVGQRARFVSRKARADSAELGVLVGMSGGVDSAVAAMLLREQGYRVVGVTLRLWADPSSADERTCCSREAVQRAKRLAHRLRIPHFIVDASGVFKDQVVQYFVDEYRSGRTPNPCAKCNARVRFGLMLDIARKLGLMWIATGHYARLTGEPPSLARGIDRDKDQSYVLAEVAPELLHQVIFPLGEMTKVEVKAIAENAGLECRFTPESQEICFVADDDHRRFLRERLGELPGPIVNREGRELGTHSGTYNFTIGQRRGLGIAGKQPLYVVGLDAANRKVVVGALAEAAVQELSLEDLTHHLTISDQQTEVQVRSTGDPVPARMTGSATLALEQPAVGVAPGQTAVMYSGEKVALAGTIVSTRPWSGSAQQAERTGGG